MLSLIMAYYENPEMLKLHLNEWALMKRVDRSLLHVIIVDDGSPTNKAADVIRSRPDYGRQYEIDIKCFRVDTDIPWNMDGCRNLGMQVARTRYALLTDMDHLLEADQLTPLLTSCHDAQQGTYYMPRRRQQWDRKIVHPHANSYLFHREDFWTMGGYDEDFAGVYGSDGNFRKCMRAGLKEQETPGFLLTQYRREEFPDASTNAYGRKESKYHRSNFPLLEAKNRAPAYKATNHVRFPWHEERV